MSKFDLKDLLNQRSKETDMQVKEYKTDGVVELVDIYDMIPSEDNFYDVTKHMDLVNSIKLLGVLQPLLLSESEEADKFSIKAGHRRREACLYLVEKEGLEKFRYVPAVIKPEQDDIIGRLTIIMANRFRDKTDWEKMQEVIQTEELLAELKGNKNLNKNTREQLKEMLGIEGEDNLKTRDFVAQILGTSAAQVGRYKAIYNNLSMEHMALFKENQISVSVASEIAGLSPEWQQTAYEKINDNGGEIQIADIKKLKQQEEASKPIAGQMKIEEANIPQVLPLTEENKECAIRFVFDECHDKSFPQEEMEKLINFFAEGQDGHTGYLSQQMLLEKQMPFENDNVRLSMNCGYKIEFIHTRESITIPVYPFWRKFEEIYGRKWNRKEEVSVVEPEPFEAKPEYKDILCYSCLHYAECDKKAGTVFECGTYENKTEAEKTEEQLYSEEQDRIDKETAKKLEELEEEIKEKILPTGDEREPRNDFELTVTMRQYAEIYYGHINFMVTKKKDYRFDDTITIKEYRHGEPSGKEMTVKVKNVIQDCTGIEDDYCVIGFYKVTQK